MIFAGWRDSSAPTLNGQKLALDRGEISRAAALLPDNAGVLLGTDTHVRLFDRTGRAIAALDVPATAWAVAVAPGATPFTDTPCGAARRRHCHKH